MRLEGSGQAGDAVIVDLASSNIGDADVDANVGEATLPSYENSAMFFCCESDLQQSGNEISCIEIETKKV